MRKAEVHVYIGVLLKRGLNMEQDTDSTVSLSDVCNIIRKEAWRLAIRSDQAQELIKAIKRNIKLSSDQSL